MPRYTLDYEGYMSPAPIPYTSHISALDYMRLIPALRATCAANGWRLELDKPTKNGHSLPFEILTTESGDDPIMGAIFGGYDRVKRRATPASITIHVDPLSLWKGLN